jgi:multidrug efflux pump subunit AcrB
VFKLWVVMLALAAIEVPILINRQMWGELAAFLSLWLVATIYASLVAARTVIPSLVTILLRVLGVT